MEDNFQCDSCKNIFDAIGSKKEWIDPIYGPCVKYTAECPACSGVSNTYRIPNQQKNNSKPDFPKCQGCSHGCNFS